MTKLFMLVLLAGIFFGCQNKRSLIPVQVIPEPLQIRENPGKGFIVGSETCIVISDSIMLPAVSLLQKICPLQLPVCWENEGEYESAFVFKLDQTLDSLSSEGYSLCVSPQNVMIRSAGPEGLFYAVETLRQIFPVNAEKMVDEISLPAVEITDSPRFSWRGVHLDVSRHFMPVDFIKKYIDYLAMHKLNVFHWHLVDGIGWRIEIKSHPELTDVGAWRVVKEDKMPWQDFEVWKAGDERPKYGGFYTQEEIKEIVAYARERFITVLPEIELPGHSEAVMQCYPELICRDARGKSLNNTGVYCASNPASYRLLEDVLDEIIDLFPSEYIHIGGDEVGKDNWVKCAACRAMMKKNHYTPHELQSHFVNHFDEYLKSKGRKLIGWHEILEGKLSPSATIMYRGGESGVAEHLQKEHPMVLTTGSHLYFDHYQSLSKHEPKAFGGFSPLQKVYNYEPVPEGLDEQHSALIMGVQANLWTEYMPDPKQVEYMLFPRIAALSEIAWQAKGRKNWAHFREKMESMMQRYQSLGVNVAPSAFRPDIQFELDTTTKQVTVNLQTELIADIYYTLDGSEPDSAKSTLFTKPFTLDQSALIKAISVKNGRTMGPSEEKQATLHKACGAKVELQSMPIQKYSAKGAFTLVDADFGGDKWGNGKWLGILDTDFSATIIFDQPISVSKIGMSCIEETGAGIYFPAGLELAVSEDGKSFQSIKSWKNERERPIAKTSDIQTRTFSLDFDPVVCKSIQIKAPVERIRGKGVFIFVDEIIAE